MLDGVLWPKQHRKCNRSPGNYVPVLSTVSWSPFPSKFWFIDQRKNDRKHKTGSHVALFEFFFFFFLGKPSYLVTLFTSLFVLVPSQVCAKNKHHPCRKLFPLRELNITTMLKGMIKFSPLVQFVIFKFHP